MIEVPELKIFEVDGNSFSRNSLAAWYGTGETDSC